MAELSVATMLSMWEGERREGGRREEDEVVNFNWLGPDDGQLVSLAAIFSPPCGQPAAAVKRLKAVVCLG